MKIKFYSLLVVLLLSFSAAARSTYNPSYNKYPPANRTPYDVQQSLKCYGENGQQLQVINEQVLQWKSSTRNQFQARARILGKVTNVYSGNQAHDHFQITIGSTRHDTIEVVYNKSFGALPKIQIGDSVEACGDYITSNAPTGRYQASPDDAIIHWVHRSNDTKKHANGYLIIDGRPYGN